MVKAMGKGGLKGLKGMGKFTKKLVGKGKKNKDDKYEENTEEMFGGFAEELR